MKDRKMCSHDYIGVTCDSCNAVVLSACSHCGKLEGEDGYVHYPVVCCYSITEDYYQ